MVPLNTASVWCVLITMVQISRRVLPISQGPCSQRELPDNTLLNSCSKTWVTYAKKITLHRTITEEHEKMRWCIPYSWKYWREFKWLSRDLNLAARYRITIILCKKEILADFNLAVGRPTHQIFQLYGVSYHTTQRGMTGCGEANKQAEMWNNVDSCKHSHLPQDWSVGVSLHV